MYTPITLNTFYRLQRGLYHALLFRIGERYPIKMTLRYTSVATPTINIEQRSIYLPRSFLTLDYFAELSAGNFIVEDN